MITLLRRIRKTLVDNGNVRKYLIYAIGEIALVVIGILLALQLNNWNSQKELKAHKLSILKEIERNLFANKNEAQIDLELIQESVESAEVLLKLIPQNSNFHDSLYVHFRRIFRARFFNGVRSGYTVLKSNPSIGIPDSINFRIIFYFEEALEDVEHFMHNL